MSELIIRPATRDDLPVLLEFEQDLIKTERPFDPTLKPGTILYYDLENMVVSRDTKLVVAENNGKVIGSGYLRIEPAKPYLRHSQRGYLGFMYVLPAWRGKNINREIIGYLSNWAREQNLTELRLDVYSDNERAINAYEKAGFEKHMLHMRMGLD